MGYGLDPNNASQSSESEHVFRKTVRRMRKEGFQPKSSTLGFNQCKLGMEDLDQMRRNNMVRKNTGFK